MYPLNGVAKRTVTQSERWIGILCATGRLSSRGSPSDRKAYFDSLSSDEEEFYRRGWRYEMITRAYEQSHVEGERATGRARRVDFPETLQELRAFRELPWPEASPNHRPKDTGVASDAYFYVAMRRSIRQGDSIWAAARRVAPFVGGGSEERRIRRLVDKFKDDNQGFIDRMNILRLHQGKRPLTKTH